MPAEMQTRGRDLVQSPQPRYRFKDGIWDVICGVQGWSNTLAAAKDLGLSDTTISRAVRGETFPGEVLMARLKHVLPSTWKHEHIFDLVLVDGDLQVPA